jgi:hypothetical protein
MMEGIVTICKNGTILHISAAIAVELNTKIRGGQTEQRRCQTQHIQVRYGLFQRFRRLYRAIRTVRVLYISPVMPVKSKCADCGRTKRFRKNVERCLACSRRAVKNKQRKVISIRNETFDLLGAECVDCGTKDRRTFTIDHLDKDGKKHRETAKDTLQRWRLYFEAALTGSHRIVIRCFNCHSIRDLKRQV